MNVTPGERGENVFDTIYASDLWTLGSGPGSIASVNKPFTRLLENFISQNKIQTLIDFGCGDWNYMRNVNINSVNYIGLDVVSAVLIDNERKFKRSGVSFVRTPENLADMPSGDLLLLKDVLVHLPNQYVSELLLQALNKFKFLISVNNFAANLDEYNVDIPLGGFRPVDISLDPFNVQCATILRYGKLRILDPRLPPPLAFLRRRFAWPGLKHVQLAMGRRA